MDFMRMLKMLSVILVIVGALNWGLVGLFDLDLVQRLFGEMQMLVKIIYILVGVGGLVMLMDIKHLMKCDK